MNVIHKKTAKSLIDNLLSEIQPGNFFSGAKPALRDFAAIYIDNLNLQPHTSLEEATTLLKGDNKNIGLLARTGITRINGELRWSSVMCLELLSKLLDPITNPNSISTFISVINQMSDREKYHYIDIMKIERHVEISRNRTIPFTVLLAITANMKKPFNVKDVLHSEEHIDAFEQFQFQSSSFYKADEKLDVENVPQPTVWSDVDITTLLEEDDFNEDYNEFEPNEPEYHPNTVSNSTNDVNSSPLQILRSKIRKASFQLGFHVDPLDIGFAVHNDPRAYRESIRRQTAWRRKTSAYYQNESSDLSILDPSFDPTKFITEVHSGTSYELLSKGLENLKVQLDSRAEQLKTISQELFSVYVSCHDNNNNLFNSILTENESQFLSLNSLTQTLKQDITDLYSKLLSNTEEADRINKTLRVIKRYQVLFSLSSAINEHIGSNRYSDIAKHYKTLKLISVPSESVFLNKIYQHLLSRFNELRKTLLDGLSKPTCSFDVVQLLLDLDCFNEMHIDPIAAYLNQQFESVFHAMDEPIHEHFQYIQFSNHPDSDNIPITNKTTEEKKSFLSKPTPINPLTTDDPGYFHSLDGMVFSLSSIFVRKLNDFLKKIHNVSNLKNSFNPQTHLHTSHHKNKYSLKGPLRMNSSSQHSPHLHGLSVSSLSISEEVKTPTTQNASAENYIIRICEKYCTTIRDYVLPPGFVMPSNFSYPSLNFPPTAVLNTSTTITVLKTINSLIEKSIPTFCHNLLLNLADDVLFFIINSFFIHLFGQIFKLRDEENWMMENDIYGVTALPKKFHAIMLNAISFLETIPVHNHDTLSFISAAPFFSSLRLFSDCLHRLVFEYDPIEVVSTTSNPKYSHKCSDGCVFAVICNCLYLKEKVLPDIFNHYLKLFPTKQNNSQFNIEFDNILSIFTILRSILFNQYVRSKVLLSTRKIKLTFSSEKNEINDYVFTVVPGFEHNPPFIRRYVYELLIDVVSIHNETYRAAPDESIAIIQSFVYHVLNFWIDMIGTIETQKGHVSSLLFAQGLQLHTETEFFKLHLKKYLTPASLLIVKKMHDLINKFCVIDVDSQKMCDSVINEASNNTKILFACFK